MNRFAPPSAEGRCERDGAEPGEAECVLWGLSWVGLMWAVFSGLHGPGSQLIPFFIISMNSCRHHHHLLLPAGHLMRPKLAKAKSGKNVDFPASGSA